MKKLYTYIGKHWLGYVFAIICMIIAIVLDMIYPMITQSIIDDVILEGKTEHDYVEVVNGKNVSYVCPQKVDKNLGEHVKLFFRVTNTFKNCTITAKCGDKILVQKKKQIAVPGEMETLMLLNTKLSETNGVIEVSLEEGV